MQKTYLKQFHLPSDEAEHNFFSNLKMTCFNNFYPFGVVPQSFRKFEFYPLTVLYGGNGCGKTTILNVIAERLGIKRSTRINKSSFMSDYIELCRFDMNEVPTAAKIITSDDVFSSIFLTREKNDIIDEKRSESFEFSSMCNTPGLYMKDIMNDLVGDESWIDNVETLQKVVSARGSTKSKFARETVGKNIIGKSNGETALEYFYSSLQEAGLYLLDEPENSLSAIHQRELAQYLSDSVRFFGAQLIIATHSPFMLSIPGVRIYNLDSEEFCVTDDWTSLDNMVEYYDLFKEHSKGFEKC